MFPPGRRGYRLPSRCDAANGNTLDGAQVTVMSYNNVIDTFTADEETDLVAISAFARDI